jgi:quercetin dioxygenase-like cupin family protein
MTINRSEKRLMLAGGLGVILVGVTLHAAVNQTIAVGTLAHWDPFGGPATITMRTLTIAPGEVLGWHYHPGIGAYTIVAQGTLVVEDGCGGETVYTQGDAFLEPANRVHRGKNLTTGEVVTAQTFLVPAGTAISASVPQLCGAPVAVEECANDGWMSFNHPRTFASQGDCLQYVITGK